jgi:hypothetical protein
VLVVRSGESVRWFSIIIELPHLPLLKFALMMSLISNGFKFAPNFDRSKMCIPVLKKFKIKYDWKENEIRNNFPYRNFSRLEIEFEIKLRELLWVEIHWKILELWISMKFGQQDTCYTLLPGKINFHQKMIIKLNSTQNGKFDWFHDSLNPKLYFWIPPLGLGLY